MLCFRKFPVAEKFMFEWGGGGRGGREYRDLPSKIFCPTVPKNFAGEPFPAVLQKFPVAKKFMDKGGGGGVQDFPSKIFCLTVPKNFVVETFCAVFQKFSGSEKVYG